MNQFDLWVLLFLSGACGVQEEEAKALLQFRARKCLFTQFLFLVVLNLYKHFALKIINMKMEISVGAGCAPYLC